MTDFSIPAGEKLTPAGCDVLLGQALRDIIRERIEQVDRDGYTIEQDLAYTPDVLPLAAASYINAAVDQANGTCRDEAALAVPDPQTWPFPETAWHPRDLRANLVKAGALIWAAIDRLDHAPRDAGDAIDPNTPENIALVQNVFGIVPLDQDEAA